jgi:hypothetical protein
MKDVELARLISKKYIYMRISKQRLKQIVHEEIQREHLRTLIRSHVRNVILEQYDTTTAAAPGGQPTWRSWYDMLTSPISTLSNAFSQGYNQAYGAATGQNTAPATNPTTNATADNAIAPGSNNSWCQNPIAQLDSDLRRTPAPGEKAYPTFNIYFQPNFDQSRVRNLQQIVENSVNQYLQQNFSAIILQNFRNEFVSECQQEPSQAVIQQIQQRIPQIVQYIRQNTRLQRMVGPHPARPGEPETDYQIMFESASTLFQLLGQGNNQTEKEHYVLTNLKTIMLNNLNRAYPNMLQQNRRGGAIEAIEVADHDRV